MASAWAKLAKAPVADHTQYLPNDGGATASSVSAWAATASRPEPSSAHSWAALGPTHSDDDVDSNEELPCAVPERAIVVSQQDINSTIAALTANSSVGQLRSICKNIAASIDDATAINQVATLGMMYCEVIDKLSSLATTTGNQFVESQSGCDNMSAFVTEQLRASKSACSQSVESRTAEAKRLGVLRSTISNRRSLIAAGVICLQRACAEVFANDLCDRVEKANGASQTYFEKHISRNIVATRRRFLVLAPTMLSIVTSLTP